MNTDERAEDEARIRALIERWATAVHAGDMEVSLPITPTTS
jgi:ketosteroid isomerase-like protein